MSRNCLTSFLIFCMVGVQASAAAFDFETTAEDLGFVPTQVAVAGTFNGWQKDANPMTADGEVFRASFPIEDGRHVYKFVATDTTGQERWVYDPRAGMFNLAGEYGTESIVYVKDDAYTTPPPIGTYKEFLWNGKAKEVRLVIAKDNKFDSHYHLREVEDGVWKALARIPGDYSYGFKVDGEVQDEFRTRDGELTRVDMPKQPISVSFQIPDVAIPVEALRVSVVGSFNEWRPDEWQLELEDGEWKGTFKAAPGRHTYRFVAFGTDKERHWFSDPYNPKYEENEWGERNNIIQVGRLAGMQGSDINSPN